MEKIMVNDFRQLKTLTDCALSPKAGHVAVVVKTCNQEDGYDFTIWTGNKEGNFRQLTSFGKESNFIWDDEETLLFSSMRKESDRKKAEDKLELTPFYRISLNGGEARACFSLPLSVSKIKRLKEGEYLVVADCDATVPDYYKMDEQQQQEIAEEKKKNADFTVLDEVPFWSNGKPGFVNKRRTRLFVYDEITNQLTPCSSPLVEVGSWAISPDAIFYSGCQYNAKIELPKDVFSFDRTTKQIKKIFVNDHFYNRSQGVSWVDNQLIYRGATIETWGQNTHPNFYRMDAQTGAYQLLHEADCSYYDCKEKENGLWINGSARVSNNLYRYTTTQGLKCVLDWEDSITSFDVCGDEIVLLAKKGNQPDECYWMNAKDQTIRQISHFHEQFLKSKKLSECEKITISSHDWDVDGWIMKPIDYDPKRSYPAILSIHGGPKGAYHGSYYHEMQVWASEGYFVFYCNPIGSDGRGNKFAEIRELHGTVDYEDIMNFTDEVLRRYPQIDSKRLGVTGVSYGGYMTNWIIGHTHRFCAATSQCSVVNWVSMYGVSDISMSFVPDQMGGSIYDKVQTYWDHSPLKYACNAKTPTLFIQPLDDFRCHLSEGLQMVTALIDQGVETRVCCFAADHHGLNSVGKPSHRERSYTETLNWMNKHCK